MVASQPVPHEVGCGCAPRAAYPGLARLVSYSLVCDERRRDEHACQFEISVSSLRASNPSIPVVLFSHGPLAPEIAELCSRFGVMVPIRAPYRDRLGGALAAQRRCHGAVPRAP